MATTFNDIVNRLWSAADKLRANTHIRASRYSVPLLGLVFLKYADQKFTSVDQILQERVRQSDSHVILSPAHYKAEGAIYLNSDARFINLRKLSTNIGEKLDNAMKLIEYDNAESLKDALPTNAYSTIDNETLKALLEAFDGVQLDIEDDLFGKIYKYFLDKFAVVEGQRGGDFFTPTSIVKLIVEIAEPYCGMIFDPACGSGGMFVQSAQFVQRHRHNFNDGISIYGQERSLETLRLCKMNLAVNGLSGDVQRVNSFYEDPYYSIGKFDFVLANPPFNISGVDRSRLLEDKKYFPFGIPQVDNANYLWIQLFYSALKESGRAGFVMPNSASEAHSSEQDIRRELIKQGVVDVIVAVGSNFFYTITLPCTLWFFDKSKRNTERGDKVLFINARQFYKQVDHAHREFTPEHIQFLTNIVRLYRGEPVEKNDESTTKLREVFTSEKYKDVPGLCRVATLAEIEAQSWSLNPIRYVDVPKGVISNTLSKRSNVFISYSYEDKKYLERLKTHLSPIVLNSNMEIWDDTKIAPGHLWREEIKNAIEHTKVAVLLISADFLASQFIINDELPLLLEAASKEGATVLPVLLSPCMFIDSPLALFQAVNSKEMTRMNKHEKEDTWVKVASRVKALTTFKN